MNPNRYFSIHNLKNMGRKLKFGCAKKIMQSGWEIFTLSPVAYITVDFKRLVRDLSQASSTLIESKCIKRKTWLLK